MTQSKHEQETVTVHDQSLWLGNERVSLVSGELHYWRIPRASWPTMLQAVTDLGIKTLSSYTAWHVHEYREHHFDFRGETSEHTDLVGYLEAVQRAGFPLLLRPGPYIFAEWDNYGIPGYLTPYHRRHPTFMAAGAHYISAVSEIIRPFLATNGGPVVALQADNMFDLGKDRYDDDLGLLGGKGEFQDFLRRKYADRIENLNQAWRSRYEHFEDALATTAAAPELGAPRRLIDYLEFRDWYTAECCRWTVGLFREHGVDVPIYSNATRDQALTSMQSSLDFMSINFYPTEGYSGKGEHQRLLDDVRLLAAVSPVPYVAELHSGTWHGYHYNKRIYQPSDSEFSWINILAAGAVGWNWYMLHDRDNWYMSPLNSNGRPRHELTEVIRRCLEVEKTTQPWRWQRQSNTGVTYFHYHHAARHRLTDDQTTTGDMGRALYQSGVDYTFFVLDEPRPRPPEVLFYDGDEWLDDTAYAALGAYVEAGGHLVFFQSIPHLDEAGASTNPLGVVLPDGVQSQGYMNTFHRDARLAIGDTEAIVPTPRRTYLYRTTPGQPIRASMVRPATTLNDNVLDEYQQLTELGHEAELITGYTEQRGRGSITVVGLPPSPDLVIALHEQLGVGIPAVPQTKGVQTALYRAEETRYLIALNNDEHEKTALIRLDLPGNPHDRFHLRHLAGPDRSTPPQERRHSDLAALPVRIGPKSGAIIEIEPAS